MDEKLPDEKFKGLYQMMLANTFNSESDKVFIYDNDGYKGLITLKCDQNVRIGLLGVRSDSQGLGIGKSLMNAADHFSYKNGWSRVDVLTQALNYGAIELYQKCGYKMVEKSCIFHLWF